MLLVPQGLPQCLADQLSPVASARFEFGEDMTGKVGFRHPSSTGGETGMGMGAVCTGNVLDIYHSSVSLLLHFLLKSQLLASPLPSPAAF